MTIENDILKKTLEIARTDGVISDDEFYIIEQVKIHSSTFYELLLKAREDGIIDEKEKSQLDTFRNAILERAQISANYDGNVSEDEKLMLTGIADILKKINYEAN